MSVNFVVITKCGGAYQAKGFATVTEAIAYQDKLMRETGTVSSIAAVD